ncbi:MAG: trypsin-like peptidase domain-containing protein [Actinomycetota bacterium]|nr:trypsin-like peptidase domain-containing protein [Actinomycetota bacterium]MDA3004149.1 trypsin-like peptidase domain-containing protein [Actinomycetota bacterium]
MFLITSSGCRSAETRTVGTLIDGGFILTVAHGVAGQTANQVTTSNGETFRATVAAIDIDLDLALLKIDPASKLNYLTPLKLAAAKAGDHVSFIAFDEEQLFTRDAKIRRRLRINTQDIYLDNKVSRPGLEVELEVSVGNSGGPLINKSGELVGIVWSTSRVVKNRSWATRSEAVVELLAQTSAKASPSNSQPLACTG